MERRNFLKLAIAAPLVFITSKLFIKEEPTMIFHSEMKKELSPEWFENNRLTIPPNVEVKVQANSYAINR